MGLGRARRGDLPSLEEFPTDLTGARKGDIRELAERFGVDFLRLQFTDILGVNKNVEVPPSQFEKALDGEIMFDGSSIEGFVRIEESDMLLKPDPTTFRMLPFDEEGGRVARLICDIHTPDGAPFDGCPRHTLKRQIARARKLGFEMMAGCEAEFFLFEKAPDGAPTTSTHDLAGYFDLGPMDKGEEIRRVIVDCLELMGFEVEAAHHEVAPGQHEIDFRYAAALVTADNLATFKLVVRQVANRYGYVASFMPKPIEGVAGSGMHTHQSLFKGSENAFFDADAEHQLSQGGAALHRGHAAARARFLRHHQPAGEQLQAPGARLRGAGERRLVDAQPLAPGAHSRPRAASVPAARTACPTLRRTRTWPSRSSSRPDSMASSRNWYAASRCTGTSSA